MADLSPGAAALLRAGRTSFRPSASDRDRVLQALSQHIAAGAPVEVAGHAGPAQTAVVTRWPLRAWVLGGAATVAVGAGVILAAHTWKAPGQSPASTMSSSPAVEPSAPAALPAPEDSSEPPPAPNPPRGTRATTRPPADSLPEEVRLLSKAEQQLNEGHADDALKTLAEHERRFPGGALAEERMAARVQSLCAAGRVTQAKAELAKLARTYPRSPHVDRARRFCGAD